MSALRLGRHDGMPMNEYQDIPALSAGGAFDIIDRCPAYYWFSSPFNPDFKPEHKRIFDFGTACHLALLEPSDFAARTVIIDADSFRTKDAQTARDGAYEAGKTPLLVKDVPTISAITKAIKDHPIARQVYDGGASEVGYVWKDEHFKVPCKLRADYVPNDLSYLADLKTTTNAHPDALARKAYTDGWFQRAAWYLDGIEAVEGKRPNDYWFVAIEKDAPHLISVCRLDERSIEWGSRMNRKAVETLAWCIEHDEAPGYRNPTERDKDKPFTLELPNFAEYRLGERDVSGHFAIGNEFLRPPS